MARGSGLRTARVSRACGRDARGPSAATLNSCSKARRHQLFEGAGAVADPALCGVQFPEGHLVSIRHEYRVVAEAALAAGRPGETALYLGAEESDLAIGPRQREHGDEMRMPVFFSQFAMHT